MTKKPKTKEQRYADSLESKGLKKTCVIIPATREDEIKQLAENMRDEHRGVK